MSKSFPKFASHAAAKCFSCNSPLHGTTDNANAQGRGAFEGVCKCGYHTWYDLKKPKGKAA
jgi:hypothetical protein